MPELIRGTAALLIEERRLLEARISQLERQLAQTARLSPACTTLLSIPGIGLSTATAPWWLPPPVDVSHFKDARHFASWFGLTTKEYSSGGCRFLGHISKRGDCYLRMLLTHLELQARSNHNKATCALANKLARICYATLRHKQRFDERQSVARKSAARQLRCRLERLEVSPSRLATSLIDHHGQQGPPPTV